MDDTTDTKESINWNRRKYSKDDFIESWNSSRSIADCARRLNLTIYGSTYTTIKNTAKSLGLDNSHHVGRAWNKGMKLDNRSKVSIEGLLVVDGTASTSVLRRRLLKEGLLEKRCYAPFCPNPVKTIDGLTGNEVDTPLTLDHINGINNDNRLENLRFICANCDRMNPTFCRGRAGFSIIESKLNKEKKKESAGIRRRNPNMSRNPPHKIEWPPTEELLLRLKTTSYVQLGRELGVSDNAIRKHIKNYPVEDSNN